MVMSPKDLIKSAETNEGVFKQLEVLIDAYLIKRFKGRGKVEYLSDGVIDTFRKEDLLYFLGRYRDAGWNVSLLEDKLNDRYIEFEYYPEREEDKEIVERTNGIVKEVDEDIIEETGDATKKVLKELDREEKIEAIKAKDYEDKEKQHKKKKNDYDIKDLLRELDEEEENQ